MKNRLYIGVGVSILLAACGSPVTHPGPRVVLGRSLPTEVRVTCDGDGTRITDRRVQPQNNGLHFEIRNRAHRLEGFVVGSYLGKSLVRGKNHFVVPVAPGALRIACGEHLARDGVVIHVVNANGVWVSNRLDCERAHGYSISDSPPDMSGAGPIELARKYLRGLTDQDHLELAGYPKGSERSVRVVRDGKVIAGAGFDAMREGLRFSGMSSCDGSGVG
jgi:hypothetical protein